MPEDDSRHKPLRYWRALALAKADALEAALELAPRSHVRGEVLCALGRFDEGLALIAAEHGDDRAEWRMLRHAYWLRRAGRAREAAETIEQRLEEWATREEVEMRLAAVRAWLDVGEPSKIAPHLEVITRLSPGRGSALVAQNTRRLDWLPRDLARLANDPALAERGVWFLSQEQSQAAADSLEKGPEAPLGVLPGRQMWNALGDSVSFVPVAEVGVRAARTVYGEGCSAWLYVHPERPGRLWLCLSTRIPAFLWPELSSEPAALCAGLAPYRPEFAADAPHVRDLPRRLRLHVGWPQVPSPYHGTLEPMDHHTFGRVAVCSPFLEAIGWGSEQAEDPHVDFVDRGGMDALFANQSGGGHSTARPAAESYRTRWSRSIVTIEEHHSGYVVDVRYRPSPHPGHVTRLNERFGTALPDDLPLDCYGVVMHFSDDMDTVDELRASITPDLPSEDYWRLSALAALLHDSLELDACLAALPDTLTPVEVARVYGRLGFLLGRLSGHPRLDEDLQFGPFASLMRVSDPYDDEEDSEDGEETDNA
ncbi:hypothetical protein BM536_036880 [Streptomyces phaeoluteigriseus]|uniref:Tetratricopeptide repeat protein n=1 Tax=Streptomyces phaeoluteigriseus TaxID=114686 RepID=A0A1V6MI68_9ACTN|nr:hypothetical protein BM536_036880 [Streptomyces phaeoluteigriseus]